MSQTFHQVFLHLVWSTRKRQRLLIDDLEDFVHRRIREIADELDLDVLAINSAWDHIHVLVEWNTHVAIADAVREFKSRVTVEWNALARDSGAGRLLKWQRGYGVVSVRKSDVPRVAEYIRLQKERHANRRVWDVYEITQGQTISDEEDDD
ncbi:MAG: IS200/IS605 family transposase [Bradymonadaceae bacterium]|nr:IS200/IS605 family transposase [Lujinxingiaceae bacterium]